MDIKTLTPPKLLTEGAGSGAKPRSEATGKERASSAASGTVGELVTLTATAKSMSAAKASAGTAPLNETKVAELKAAIRDGSYQIDNQRVADKMIGLERQIVSRGDGGGAPE